MFKIEDLVVLYNQRIDKFLCYRESEADEGGAVTTELFWGNIDNNLDMISIENDDYELFNSYIKRLLNRAEVLFEEDIEAGDIVIFNVIDPTTEEFDEFILDYTTGLTLTKEFLGI